MSYGTDGMPDDRESWYGTDPQLRSSTVVGPDGDTGLARYLAWSIDPASVTPLP